MFSNVIMAVLFVLMLILIGVYLADKRNKKFESNIKIGQLPSGKKFTVRIMPPSPLMLNQGNIFNGVHDASLRAHLDFWTELHKEQLAKGIAKDLKNTIKKSLDEQLQDAVKEEDYLLAAKLRDQINSLKKTT